MVNLVFLENYTIFEIFKPLKYAYGVCLFFCKWVTQAVFWELDAHFDPNWAKNVQFSNFSNPLNQTNYMPTVFAHAQKVSLFFWGWVTQAVFRE